MRPPSLFISHGSPMILLDDCPARRFMHDFGAGLDKPSAILMISAHWDTPQLAVGAAAAPGTIHDFYGFPEALYRFHYGAPGAPEVAERAADLLRQAGGVPVVDVRRGLDHGAWVPLA